MTSDPGATASKSEPNRLEALLKKYGEPTPSGVAARAFDYASDEAYAHSRGELKRISSGPGSVGVEATAEELAREVAEINVAIAELAETYGELKLDFNTTIDDQKLFGPIEDAWVNLNENIPGRRAYARGKKTRAITERGKHIDYLIGQLAKVIDNQHQVSIKGQATMGTLQVENVALMRTLDQRLIGHLKGGYTSDADRMAVENELRRLMGELAEIDKDISAYEQDVKTAQQEGDVAKVDTLTQEMSRVLDIKAGIVDGRLSAEGVVREARRSLLNYAEGTQSTKGAIATSWVNYEAVNALRDAMDDLEIKYRNAKDTLVPVFRIQGKIAAAGTAALAMKEALQRVAELSDRTMDVDVRLALHLAEEAYKLLVTPLQNVQHANEAVQRLRLYSAERAKKAIEWAQAQRSVADLTSQTNYARPR